jgi:hypothetical protein
VPNTWQPSPLAQGIIGLGNYLKNPGQIFQDISNLPPIKFPVGQPQGGITGAPAATNRPRIGSLPASARQIMQYPEGVPTGVGGGNAGAAISTLIPASNRGQAPAAGAGPAGVSPNTIVQGQDGIPDEYRQRLAAYNKQGRVARQALQGYDPSKGPIPGAAQEARDQGMDIWKDFYAGSKMAQPGGAVGTFNPLMQARGDVPSMEELWKGVGGGAPTAGPSNDAIRAAMASGQYYAPSGGPSPVSGFDTSFNPAAEAQEQQFKTAEQAGVGTESSTALQRAGDFLQNMKLTGLNWGSYNFPGRDYAAMQKNMVNNRNDYAVYFGGPE